MVTIYSSVVQMNGLYIIKYEMLETHKDNNNQVEILYSK